MEKETVAKIISEFFRETDVNFIPKADALLPSLAGRRIFEDPIAGFAAADNELLANLKNIPAARIRMDPPRFWLPEAETLITFFFPFTETVRLSNRGGEITSEGWRHGRIHGQKCIEKSLRHVADALIAEGFKAAVPVPDERQWATMAEPDDPDKLPWSTNWSEKHAAFITGLGTFSLSDSLITKRGTAGRFGSVVTSLKLTPDIPNYTDPYAYCTRCGICVKSCPGGAISKENGRSQALCRAQMGKLGPIIKPYAGCGKCQVGVPCETRNPSEKLGRHEYKAGKQTHAPQ